MVRGGFEDLRFTLTTAFSDFRKCFIVYSIYFSDSDVCKAVYLPLFITDSSIHSIAGKADKVCCVKDMAAAEYFKHKQLLIKRTHETF